MCRVIKSTKLDIKVIMYYHPECLVLRKNVTTCYYKWTLFSILGVSFCETQTEATTSSIKKGTM